MVCVCHFYQYVYHIPTVCQTEVICVIYVCKLMGFTYLAKLERVGLTMSFPQTSLVSFIFSRKDGLINVGAFCTGTGTCAYKYLSHYTGLFRITVLVSTGTRTYVKPLLPKQHGSNEIEGRILYHTFRMLQFLQARLNILHAFLPFFWLNFI